MENNESFVLACANNDIGGIKKMIAEGEDYNGVNNRYGYSGLMLAMGEGHTEAARILLERNDIKIDTKDIHGYTALHHACNNKQLECVKLFLDHPSCTKAIVKMNTNNGITAEDIASRRAEIIAGKRGNQECTRLVRKYIAVVEEDNRNVDDLVEFITRGGETEKKKKRKKRSSLAQPSSQPEIAGCSGGNSRKTESIDVECIKDANKTDSTNDTKQTKLINIKEELEKEITKKRMQIGTHEQNVKSAIDEKSDEIKNLVFMMEKSKDKNEMNWIKVNELDIELSDLEIKMAELNLRKSELLAETTSYEERVETTLITMMSQPYYFGAVLLLLLLILLSCVVIVVLCCVLLVVGQ